MKGAAGLPLAGFWPADNRMLMANRKVDATGWFWENGVYDIQRPNPDADIGLPLNPDPRSACGILLAGKVAEAFSSDELRDMLRKGVMMDGFALQVLWSQGLGELTGVKPGQTFPSGVSERLTSHALNGHYAGDGRDALVGPEDGVFNLMPVAEGVGDLVHLINYDGAGRGVLFLDLYEFSGRPRRRGHLRSVDAPGAQRHAPSIAGGGRLVGRGAAARR